MAGKHEHLKSVRLEHARERLVGLPVDLKDAPPGQVQPVNLVREVNRALLELEEFREHAADPRVSRTRRADDRNAKGRVALAMDYRPRGELIVHRFAPSEVSYINPRPVRIRWLTILWGRPDESYLTLRSSNRILT